MPGLLNENEINNGVARYWTFGTGIVMLTIGAIYGVCYTIVPF